MEGICSRCHALIAEATNTERCPACGGEIAGSLPIAQTGKSGLPDEVDHRGIVLPQRHALGGIITPQ